MQAKPWVLIPAGAAGAAVAAVLLCQGPGCAEQQMCPPASTCLSWEHSSRWRYTAWENRRQSHFYWLSDKCCLTLEPSAGSVLTLLSFTPLFKRFLERRNPKDCFSPFNFCLCSHLEISVITQWTINTQPCHTLSTIITPIRQRCHVPAVSSWDGNKSRDFSGRRFLKYSLWGFQMILLSCCDMS